MFASIQALIRNMFIFVLTFVLGFAGIGGIGSNPGEPEVKNVIVLIGDGMGENHLEWTKTETGKSLTMDSELFMKGYSETNDYFGGVTDSAAGGTAVACGVRVISGTIGVYPSDIFGLVSYPMNLSELAMSKGMKTGVVTSDSTSGATPASFSAHTSSRDNEADITNQQLNSGIDLIWGANTSSGTEDAVAKSAYTRVTNLDDINALADDEKSFGQFNGDIWADANENGPKLSQLAEAAIQRLENENGFFLMIEGAHIDKHSHGNNEEGMMEALLEFDATIALVLEYAVNSADTLVVITADHETGGITKSGSSYKFTSGSHSGANVPLRVYGCESFIEDGASMKNRMIPVFIADKLGCEKDEFPRTLDSNKSLFNLIGS